MTAQPQAVSDPATAAGAPAQVYSPGAFAKWLAAFGLLAGALLLAGDSATWGPLGEALAWLIAVSVVFLWGGRAWTEFQTIMGVKL